MSNRRVGSKTIIALLSWFLIATASAETHAPQADAMHQTQAVLRIGMFTEFEPLVFIVSGEIQGIEVDLATLIGRELDRRVEIRELKFPELIPALQADEIDVVMSGMSITAERSLKVTFTNPYLEIGQMAIVNRERASEFASPAALAKSGVRVAVQIGSTGEHFVTQSFPDADIFAYEGVESGLEALRTNEVDIFVHDSTTSWQLSRSFVNDNLLSLGQFLTKEQIAWAVPKDNHDLRAALNLALEKLQRNGEVSRVLGKWLPVIPVQSPQP